MSKIESRIGKLAANDEAVYSLISDFRNFAHLLPADKVKNWQTDGTECSFNIDGVGKMGLKYTERTPFNLLKLSSSGDSPVPFNLWIQLKKIEDMDTRIKITLEPEVNQMVMLMIRNPLEKFLNSMVDQMESYKW